MINFAPEKVKVVKIGQVRPNQWNPKEHDTYEFEKIKKGIGLKGLRLPIIVREIEPEGDINYEILDGEQRYTACKQLGFDEIIIYNEGKIEDKEAQELTIWYQQQVPFEEVATAKLVTTIVEKYPDYQLPYTEEEIEAYKKLTEFDWDKYKNEQEAIKDNKLRSLDIKVTLEQYDLIMEAIKAAQSNEINEADALSNICKEYLGKNNETNNV